MPKTKDTYDNRMKLSALIVNRMTHEEMVNTMTWMLEQRYSDAPDDFKKDWATYMEAN